MEQAAAAARFPDMADLAPGDQPPDDLGRFAEIRILMNTPYAAWSVDDWRTAGWVQITDPAVARNTGVPLGSFVPSMPERPLGEGEQNHLESEWLQLGWTRLREDPLDPNSPVERLVDDTEIWVPPGPYEWADVRSFARLAPPGGAGARSVEELSGFIKARQHSGHSWKFGEIRGTF